MIFFPYLNDASYVKMRLNVNFFLIFNSLQPKCYFAIFLIRLIFKGFQKWDSKTIQKCIHLSHAENEYCVDLVRGINLVCSVKKAFLHI